MQYAQQGIRDWLYRAISESRIAGGQINFTDQSVNQELALASSYFGRLATVDLSEASDRVPHDLAMRMFDSNPELRESIEACRSTNARMPDGTIIGPLRKFASMGSALCFPVESMYFYTICVLARLRIHKLPLSWRYAFQVSRDIHVYGDDIIVPACETSEILDYLRKYNCKVNARKTYYSGFFRESCGVDAYYGDDVTPVYIRRLRPENHRDHASLISWCATANSFYRKGYWRTAQYMFTCIERASGTNLPYVSEDSGALGRKSFLGYRSVDRWNDAYQRLEVRALVPKPVYRTDVLDGYGALQKSLMALQESEVDPFGFNPRDKKHLERSEQHGVAALESRWVPA
jgi:hypothetical protein